MSRWKPEGSIPSGTTLDRYVVESLLGCGGMGEVYAARDQQLGRIVALKILAADRAADPSRVQRFLREAQLASSLNHPAIVTVYDSGSTGDIHFLAMELIDGETLSTWLRSNRDPGKIVDVLAGVAEGLARAHASGIVHRDLKPANIMIARGGHPKILDFGVAKLIEPQPGVVDTAETAPSRAIGTGAYMAPEQVQGIAIDHRADIFAFGAVLYEALTGQAPFARDTAVESMHAVLHDEPAEADVAPHLARIIRRCLVKDREERYQSIKDVSIDLREASRQQAWSTRVGRRRVPLYAGAAAVIAIALMIVASGDRLSSPVALASVQTMPAPVMMRMTNSGNISAGAVSPDGNYIVHATVDGENQTVWVKQVATGTSVRIIAPQPVYYTDFRVSSDGNYVFYTVAKRSEPNITDLRRISVLGGESRLIAKDMEGIYTVSPDSEKVAFVRFNAFERLYRLTMSDVELGNETVVLARPFPGFFASLAWAPDSKSIAFVGAIEVAGKPLRPAIFSINLATRRVSRVPSPDWTGIGGLTWLPDNSGMLVTVADKLQPRQIWFLPNGSTNARKITSDISMYNSVTVTADSRSLVAHRADVTANLWVIDTQEPSKPRALTTGLWNCFGSGGVRWMPDGRILYTVCGSTPGLNTIDANTGEVRQLTHGFFAWRPAIAPDGQRIVVISDRGGREELWTCDINGNDFRQLTNQGRVDSPSWAPDGKSVYFNTAGTDQFIWRVALDGPPQQVNKTPTAAPALSPDGKTILCRLRSTDPSTPLWRTAIFPASSPNTPKFMSVPRSGGPPRAQWVNSTTFAYVDGIGGIANLWLQNVDGSAPRQLTRFDSGVILNYDFSRDGRYIAMSHGEHVNDIVLIRDFR